MSSFSAQSILEDRTEELLSLFPNQKLADHLRILHDGNAMLNDFMATTVDLLVSDVPLARDTAKEALGSELNPRLLVRLFKQLNE